MNRAFLTFDELLKLYPTGSVWETTKTKQSPDINYTKDGGYISIEVPGFNKNNLTIEVDGNVLLVSGKRTTTVNGKTETKTISEQYKINDSDANSIEATVEDGILTIFIPNLKSQQKKVIKVQ